MAAYLRVDSIADLPQHLRMQATEKILRKPQSENTAQMPEASVTKYHNEKTEVNGIKFDSRKEARRYEQLIVAMKLGAIRDLRLQVDFTLIEAYTDHTGQRHQALRYKADFTYRVAAAGYERLATLGYEDIEYWRSCGTGALVIEDVKSKGTKTRVYINKKKMMAENGHIIREV